MSVLKMPQLCADDLKRFHRETLGQVVDLHDTLSVNRQELDIPFKAVISGQIAAAMITERGLGAIYADHLRGCVCANADDTFNWAQMDRLEASVKPPVLATA